MTNEEIREHLLQLDADEDIEVTDWEAEFLETMLKRHPDNYTHRQREAAIRMIERYLDGG